MAGKSLYRTLRPGRYSDKRLSIDPKTGATVYRPPEADRPDHQIQYQVRDNRLVCKRCGEPIVGARTGFTGAWEGGVHERDRDRAVEP